VPSGTSLTPIAGDRTVSERGAVVDGWDVDGCIVVAALGVTIQHSRARCITLESDSPARYCDPSESATIRDLTGCTVVPGVSDVRGQARRLRLVIRDSEIDCRGRPGEGGTGIGDRNMVVVRVDITGCENGFDADSYVTITDSYIHDLYNSSTGDPHTDGLQSGIGRDLQVEHNVFYGFSTGCTFPDDSGSCNGTSAINIGGQPDMATVADSVVRRNLLAGGAYTLYCPLQPPMNFTVSENRFSTVFSDTAPKPADRDRVGAYGPEDGCDEEGVTAVANRLLDHARKVTSPLPFE
jgi:hypothetical protein